METLKMFEILKKECWFSFYSCKLYWLDDDMACFLYYLMVEAAYGAENYFVVWKVFRVNIEFLFTASTFDNTTPQPHKPNKTEITPKKPSLIYRDSVVTIFYLEKLHKVKSKNNWLVMQLQKKEKNWTRRKK